jgi:hypothetical protein
MIDWLHVRGQHLEPKPRSSIVTRSSCAGTIVAHLGHEPQPRSNGIRRDAAITPRVPLDRHWRPPSPYPHRQAAAEEGHLVGKVACWAGMQMIDLIAGAPGGT